MFSLKKSFRFATWDDYVYMKCSQKGQFFGVRVRGVNESSGDSLEMSETWSRERYETGRQTC